MALGKNMKVDRLIPLKGDKERSSSKESEKKARRDGCSNVSF